jgi:hypothetical protein
MEISKGVTYFELNNYFVSRFPYLKLRFFRKVKNQNEEIPLDTKLTCNEETFIEFRGEQSIQDVINELQTALHVQVQIFRRSGKLYIETSKTNNWTLTRQNEEGAELSANC